jgi:hypothetical protein
MVVQGIALTVASKTRQRMAYPRLAGLLALSGCNLVFELQGPPDAGRVCPAEYERLEIGSGATGDYRFVTIAVQPFVVAEADCKNDGIHTHLAVIGSPASATAESNVVFQRARQLEQDAGVHGDVLVGLTIRTGTFRWITDEPLAVPPDGVPPWAATEPMDTMNRQCAELDIDQGQLVTTPCELPDPYVCECDAFDEEPISL